jgi:ABC-type multidrug transport system fused ATPase/permease subunit
MMSYLDLWKKLLYFLDKDRNKFLRWNIPYILSNIFTLIQPILIGSIINFFANYSSDKSLNEFYLYLGLFLGGSIIAQVLRISARGKMFEIKADLEFNLRTKGFNNIQNNALDWNQQENSGNKLQRIDTGTKSLIDFVGMLGNDIFYIVISIIGILGFFALTNLQFLIFFLIYAILYFLLLKYWNRKNPEMLKRLNSAREKSTGKMFEGLNNLLTIKSLGAINSFQHSINNAQHEQREATKDWERLGVYKWISLSSFDFIFIAGFFVLIAIGITSSQISVGLVYVLYSYFTNMQEITSNLNNVLTKLIEIKSNVARMMPIYEIASYTSGQEKFPKDWDVIKIVNGSFEYVADKNKVVFQNINFEVAKNSFVGITGESGSGKSSLLKVLLGLYPVKDGEYLIGKRSFYDIGQQEVLDNMTVVLQDTELFNVSLLENITLFKDVDLDKLKLAIEIACLDDVVNELPEGLNTLVGEKGVRLSGGQRQRIGIARAIYKDSQIILMDESTSNLDTATEQVVMSNILTKLQDKTLIVVAHRLSTLEKANKVYRFEEGKLLLK